MSQSISYLSLLHGAVAGACLLIALTHLLLFARSTSNIQRSISNLAVAIMALAAGTLTYFELQKALASDVDMHLAGLYGDVVASVFVLMATLVFLRSYFELAIDGLFVMAMTVSIGTHIYLLAFFPGSFYTEIDGLIFQETAWGETYAKLESTVSRFKYTADLSSLLVLSYAIRATISGMRRDKGGTAIFVGGSVAGFMLIAGVLVPLNDAGLIRSTMPVGLPFLAIVLALTYQLIDDRIRMNAVRLEVEQLRRTSLAGEIAASLMHELRQPLTSILSNAQAAGRFLDMDPPDLEEVRASINDVVSEDKRAAEITSGLRHLLEQESPQTSVFDMNSTVRHVARMLAGEFNIGGTRVALSLHPSPVLVNASRVQIEQVLINLALNALRALRDLPPGERALRFTTKIVNGYAKLGVSDSGPGIAPDIRARLFEPFTSGGDGLGMGLAICKRIVDSHDGRIQLEDSELGGARFAVVLPLRKPRET